MRINEMENLLRTGSLGAPAVYKWGAPGREGMRYSWHQFGQQAIVMPLYIFMKVEGYAYYIVNMASTALAAVLMLRMLYELGFTARASLAASLAYGLGSLAWYYASKTPHEHALAIAFIMGGVYYAFNYQRGYGKANLCFSMLSIGAGFTVRYDVILALLPIWMYLYMGRKEHTDRKFSPAMAALFSALLLAPFFIADLSLNYIKFGDIFETGHAGGSPLIKKHFGIEFVPRGLIGATLSPGRSIFLFSPVLILFPFYVREFKRKADPGFFFMSVAFIALYGLFYTYHHSWDGDWCFGPRYFLVIAPFMVMASVPAFESFRKRGRLRKALVVIVLLCGVLVQVVFVSSNSWLSNVMKFGVDDDSLPEISRLYTRDFGPHGSWQWLYSYFPLRYSQFFNQFKIFRYTVLINADPSNIRDVALEIRDSDAPFLLLYLNLLRELDLWWAQERSSLDGRVVILPLLIAAFAIVRAFMISGKLGAFSRPSVSP